MWFMCTCLILSLCVHLYRRCEDLRKSGLKIAPLPTGVQVNLPSMRRLLSEGLHLEVMRKMSHTNVESETRIRKVKCTPPTWPGRKVPEISFRISGRSGWMLPKWVSTCFVFVKKDHNCLLGSCGCISYANVYIALVAQLVGWVMVMKVLNACVWVNQNSLIAGMHNIVMNLSRYGRIATVTNILWAYKNSERVQKFQRIFEYMKFVGMLTYLKISTSCDSNAIFWKWTFFYNQSGYFMVERWFFVSPPVSCIFGA